MKRSRKAPPCRAVIFDFDGLLADTEPLHYESFAKVLAEEGIHITREENDTKYMGLHPTKSS